MPKIRRITGEPILSAPSASANAEALSQSQPDLPRPPGISQAVVAISLVVLLLALATTSQGAFAISRWAPLALFALALLIGAVLAPGRRRLPASPAIRIGLAGIWGLAAWSMLSMLWAQSSADAFQAGNRMVLYAAFATLPFALPLPRRTLAAAGWAIAAAIGAIALYVLVRLLIDGSPLFLAGRLNGPVNYRNATALLFALPVWSFIVAAAGRGYRRPVRAAALSLAVMCLGLAFLTQSRGILLGLAAGGCVALACGPDRVRRAWIGALALGVVALASPWLLRPFHAFDGGRGTVDAHQIKVAAMGLAVASLVAFSVGMMVALFDTGLRVGSAPMRHVRRAARLALACGVIGWVAVVGVSVGNPATYLHQKWNQFRSLQSSTPTTTRLLTVGGQRYDLWRVALKEFDMAPVIGVGADNYSFDYYRYRATNRNLNDPHSLVFALLSENGAVGVILFCLFLGGIAAVMRGGWRTLSLGERRHAIGPATAGAVLLGQSTVDWIWLIPGLTTIGVFALSVAAAQASPRSAPDLVHAPDPVRPAAGGTGRAARGGGPTRKAARAGSAAALLVATLAVLALFLSDAFIQRARTVVADPPAELSAAATAAQLDPWSVTARYLRASAFESEGDRAEAYQQLNQALALEPDNSATLGVLGDFESRGRNFTAAREYYRRALALDPLDTGLQQLARIGESSRAHVRSRRR